MRNSVQISTHKEKKYYKWNTRSNKNQQQEQLMEKKVPILHTKTKKKRLNQSASEYISNTGGTNVEHFQKFIHQIEQQHENFYQEQHRQRAYRQQYRESYLEKKRILPLNVVKTEHDKKGNVSINLEFSKIMGRKSGFIQVRPNMKDIENVAPIKLPLMLHKDKKWKVKYRGDEKNLISEEQKSSKHSLHERGAKPPMFKNLNIPNKQPSSSLQENCSIKNISTSFPIKPTHPY